MNPIRLPLAFLLFTCFLFTNSGNFASDTVGNSFNVAGQMGLMKFVIIPAEKQSDIEFHRKIVKEICIQGQTCFLNFFTNSKNAPKRQNARGSPTRPKSRFRQKRPNLDTLNFSPAQNTKVGRQISKKLGAEFYLDLNDSNRF